MTHRKICCKNLTFHSFYSEKGEETRVRGYLTDLTNQEQARFNRTFDSDYGTDWKK